MIIDSSAILAVIGKEPGYERIIHALATSQGTRIGAPARLETGIVLMARFGPWSDLTAGTPRIASRRRSVLSASAGPAEAGS